MLLNHLTDLHTPRLTRCDCGRIARYTLPIAIRLSGPKQFSERARQETLYLCGSCLALEIAGRERCPAKGDLN